MLPNRRREGKDDDLDAITAARAAATWNCYDDEGERRAADPDFG